MDEEKTLVYFITSIVSALTPIVAELFWLAFFALPFYGIYKGFDRVVTFLKPYYVECAIDNWMIVLRDGKPIKMGNGMYSFLFPGDQVIRFPTLIKEVSFEAEQVTSEMQGVRVFGSLVWSPNKDQDGPFKLYKAFGDELQKANSAVINEKLQNMATAVVRDRVANLTIEDLLRNRNQLKKGIAENIQKTLTGWGMYVESIEISDVQIVSGSLFKNMQTEYRDELKLKAVGIEADIQNQIGALDATWKGTFDNKATELSSDNAKLKLELANQIETLEMKSKLDKQKMVQDLNHAKYETEKLTATQAGTVDAMYAEHSRAYAKKKAEQESALLTDNIAKARLIAHLKTRLTSDYVEIAATNVGDCDALLDPLGSYMRQIANSYDEFIEEGDKAKGKVIAKK